MAKEVKVKSMERVYVIPLRKEFLKTPKWKRSKKSIKTIRKFVERHMKVEKVLIGKELNEKIWERGSKNPPSKIKVRCVKKEDSCYVNLFALPVKQSKESKAKGKEKELVKKGKEKEKKESKAKGKEKELVKKAKKKKRRVKNENLKNE